MKIGEAQQSCREQEKRYQEQTPEDRESPSGGPELTLESGAAVPKEGL